MRTHLPHSSKGFTLIELLVVVSIIAILAVIGVSIYANAQKNARDGIRRAEIASLGRSIESTKDPTAANYLYSYSPMFVADYPVSARSPRDPLKSPTEAFYCILAGASPITSDPLPSTWPDPNTSAGNCPTGYTVLIRADNGNYNTNPSNILNSPGARFWRICARLEGGSTSSSGNPFCVGNSQ